MSSLFASRQARQGPVGALPADESRRAAHQAHDPSAPLGPTNKFARRGESTTVALNGTCRLAIKRGLRVSAPTSGATAVGA